MWRVKNIQQVYDCTISRPFEAFSAAIVGLKFHIKNLNAKPIVNIKGGKWFNCILKSNYGYCSAFSGQHFFSTVTREGKCTTVNGVCVCVLLWVATVLGRGCVWKTVLLRKEIVETNLERKREKFID